MKKPLEISFWEKVDIRGDDECWEWKACKDSRGYGQLTINRKNAIAHRVSYTLAKGEIPPGLELDHLCKNPACVNPNHLEAVTRQENIRRSSSVSVINANKTHCKRGHLLPPPTLRSGEYARICLICQKEQQIIYNATHIRTRHNGKSTYTLRPDKRGEE